MSNVPSVVFRWLVWGVIIGLLVACTPAAPSQTATPVPSTATPVPSTSTPVASTATPSQQTVKIFLIALEDNGRMGKQVGCGDSVVPVEVTIPPTQDPLRGALEALLSIKEQFYGQSGLYNALHQSNLQVESDSIEGGKAIVHLTGQLVLGGECDNPRVEAQIDETVLQFPDVTQAEVYVNDQTLQQALSLK
jgi:hypothetical protein